MTDQARPRQTKTDQIRQSKTIRDHLSFCSWVCVPTLLHSSYMTFFQGGERLRRRQTGGHRFRGGHSWLLGGGGWRCNWFRRGYSGWIFLKRIFLRVVNIHMRMYLMDVKEDILEYILGLQGRPTIFIGRNHVKDSLVSVFNVCDFGNKLLQ